VAIRRARTADVPGIFKLIEAYTRDRILLGKERVTLYEDVQEFWVAERVRSEPGVGAGAGADDDASDNSVGKLIGCGALHVMWEDLAEIRTLAVAPGNRGLGVGHLLLEALLGQARELGVRRLFCLTFEVDFFARHGFRPIQGPSMAPEVYVEMLRSPDEGVAEFLDLARVKPNTLGNTRMLREL
jgi:amino-acid N-acetyltransferase